MKAIKISPENALTIEDALKTVNGRAEYHAYTTFPEIEGLAATANSLLTKTLLPKSDHKKARLVAISGVAVSNAYAKKGRTRAATRVELECRSTGWFITAAAPATVGQSGGNLRLVLTPAQKEASLARFAATLHTA
jgi:7-keto-8-aminopelargonate synthetase-like enzyme